MLIPDREVTEVCCVGWIDVKPWFISQLKVNVHAMHISHTTACIYGRTQAVRLLKFIGRGERSL